MGFLNPLKVVDPIGKPMGVDRPYPKDQRLDPGPWKVPKS